MYESPGEALTNYTEFMNTIIVIDPIFIDFYSTWPTDPTTANGFGAWANGTSGEYIYGGQIGGGG